MPTSLIGDDDEFVALNFRLPRQLRADFIAAVRRGPEPNVSLVLRQLMRRYIAEQAGAGIQSGDDPFKSLEF